MMTLNLSLEHMSKKIRMKPLMEKLKDIENVRWVGSYFEATMSDGSTKEFDMNKDHLGCDNWIPYIQRHLAEE